MKYSVATDYNNLNSGKGFKKGSTTVNVDGSPDLSLNLLWTTNLESGDNYILATDSFTANHTNNTSSAIPVFYTMERSELGIISASNGLPNSPRNFTTSGSGLNFIASNNYFILDPNNPLPNIVTTGSSLILDASFLASYPTTASTWYDLSGNAFNGTLINGTAWNSNGWFDFDGINDYINLGSGVLVFDPSATNFSMGGFLNITAHKNYNTLINIGGSGAAHNALQGNSGGYIEYRTRPNAGTSVKQIESTITLSTGRWYHTYVVCDTVNAYLYINGELNNTNALSGMPTTTSGLNKDIGFYRDSALYFNGDIGPCQIYIGNALTSAEILQNYYQAPIVTDGLIFATDAGNLVSYESGSNTTYSLTGSLSGSLVNGVEYLPLNKGVFNFDGVDSQIQFTEVSQSTSEGWSHSTWVYFDYNLSTLRNTIVGTSTNAQAPGWWRLYNDISSGTWRTRILLYYKNSSGNFANLSLYVSPYGTSYVDPALQLEFWTQKWWNVTFTSSPLSQVKMYFNGSLISNANLAGAQDTGLIVNRLGVYSTSLLALDGKISNCLMYNRELTAEEVSQNFNAQRSRFGV
jgi:hypothetical protein